MSARIPNLDLLRAIAILMVVVYHVVQWLPVKPKWIELVSAPGEYGVNLFFALSGFLVGGLYFRERGTFGSVQKLQFILRRVTRTVPVYLLALAASFAGANFFTGERFSFLYLLFLQNYMVEIPFFKVSWSLCVEEHFYAVLPFALGCFFYFAKILNGWLIKGLVLTLLLLPTYLRISDFEPNQPFGVSVTASQYYLDALGFGVLAAWLRPRLPNSLTRSNVGIIITIVGCCGLLVASGFLSKQVMFGLGLLIMSILFAGLVLLASMCTQLSIAKSYLVKLIAVASYSIYVTQAMAFQACNMLIGRLPQAIQELWPLLALFLGSAALVGGVAFYKFVEQPLLVWRSRVCPARRDPRPVPRG